VVLDERAGEHYQQRREGVTDALSQPPAPGVGVENRVSSA
jgi:hypothetical protein